MSHIHVTNPIDEDVLADLRRSHHVTVGFGDDARGWGEVATTVEATIVRAETIDARMIASAPRLKIIARHGVGTDNVDLDAAAAAGIWVTTTPGANARAVAEHVFALMLTLIRRVREASSSVQRGRWSEERPSLTGGELNGRTLLLVGGGGIAALVAPIARGFGMRVVVADPYLAPEAAHELGVGLAGLDDALPSADVVSLHVPLTAETRHLLDDRRLGLLPARAVVINTSRGGVIDEAALVARLRSGALAGAGLDVIEAESIDMNDPLTHTRTDLTLGNLLVTPHVAGQTEEALVAVGRLAAQSVEQALAGRRPDRAVRDLTATAVV